MLNTPKPTDNGTYVLGAWVSGTDPVGIYHIKVSPKPRNQTTSVTLSLETRFTNSNVWLQWIVHTA